jgi:predicted pyridoxine 5'-phosphate oxidase superfamily flavin-nucleotide-binding protein
MAKLTDDMKRVIDEQRLGFVATANGDGTPNLSPKATFVVLDDTTIAFAEIRSPNTMRNIAAGSPVDVNFVDPFVRKGYRFKGRAEIVARGEAGFDDLMQHFAGSGDLAKMIGAIVRIKVEAASALISPAYDRGQTENDLRRGWTERFRRQQPGGEFDGG